ncbi:acriflavine resistance protein B [Fulvitalea axinellae]|uniref:Acriflavine resistance protein B n=1 Tax=Fulvitalea axinellae TaxID=1182444 RepID=A0AAU9CET8_9BACT|nr:acriflavine resistance protein B [Fulvitalea axinellae]
MKKLTSFSVRYPVTVLMLVLAVLLLGTISFGKLGIDLFPDMESPKLFIELKAGERSPEEIERQFVTNLEGIALQQRDVSEVYSVCRVGSSRITVQYNWGKDMDEAFLDLQRAITPIQAQNATTIEELSVTRHSPNEKAVMLFALTHPGVEDTDEIRRVAENYIRNELIRAEGVADVRLIGKETRELIVEADPYLMEAHGVTASQINSKIQEYNRSVSGGSIVETGTKYTVKGVSLLESPEAFGDIILKMVESKVGQETQGEPVPVFLREVAKIRYENSQPDNIARVNGRRCIGMAVYKEPGFNTVKAVENVNTGLDKIKDALPGYNFTQVYDQGAFIQSAIGEVKESALVGIVLAVIVLFVFLRRVGVTMIISVAIPVSIVATFNLMYFNGLTLNIMTLGGLALGAGMLVDNAIVVMENIFRHIESGKTIKQSAIDGTAEIGGAITASTLTTIVVFLPIVYLHGASGELFKDQAWTVAFSLLSSLAVAILLIPMLVSTFFKDKKQEASKKAEEKSVKFSGYGRFLDGVLRVRTGVLIGAIALVALGFVLVPIVGSEYVPSSDSNTLTVKVTLPESSPLLSTDRVIQNFESVAREHFKDSLEVFYTQTGPVDIDASDESAVFASENTAEIKLKLKPEVELSMETVVDFTRSFFSGNKEIKLDFIRDETALNSTLGDEEAPLVVEVIGSETGPIMDLAKAVMDTMTRMDDVYNVKNVTEGGAKQVDVTIDKVRAGIYGVTVEQIVSQLKGRLLGEDAGKFEYEGEMKEIRVKMPDTYLTELRDIPVQVGEKYFRLSDVASVSISDSPKEVLRRNQNKIGKITAHVKDGKPFDHVVLGLEEKLSQLPLPQGYRVKVTGQEEQRKESVDMLTFALILSVILVYMVMASQFESLVHPFTILLTIPLAAVGSILTFFFIGEPLNIMAYIGIIMLAGIAVNDSIILVDAINQRKAEGYPLRKAIVLAGEQRIRPIVMTSLTTILALLPMVFGFGDGAELRAPMAWAVIGGLVTSTLLTLVVIPCVYEVFDTWVTALMGKKQQEPEQELV